MLQITETVYRLNVSNPDWDDDTTETEIAIQREPRWIAPFPNTDDEETADDHPGDRFVPDVLLDEIPEPDPDEIDPDERRQTPAAHGRNPNEAWEAAPVRRDRL